MPVPVRRLVIASLLAAGLAAAPVGLAHADPKGDTFTVECENGVSGTAVTPPGNGQFTPALLTGSNVVIIPVSFLDWTGVAYDETGAEVARFTDDTVMTKGSGKQRGLVRCTAHFEGTSTLTEEEAEAEGLPGAGTYTFEGSGTVLAQVRGR